MLSAWGRLAGLLILAGLAIAWVPHPAVQAGFCLLISGFAVAWLAVCLRRKRGLTMTPAWILLACVPAWIALQRALFGSMSPIAAGRELATWSAAALAALVLLNEIDGSRRVSAAIRFCAAASGVIAVWSLFQGLTSHGRVFWLWESGLPIERVWGPFLYHNKLAQFAELVLPMVICLAVIDIGRRWQWVAVAASLLAVTAVAASRAGVVLLFAEVVLSAFLLALRRLISWSQASLLAGQLVLVAAAAVGVAGWENLRDRIEIRQMLQDRRFDLYASSVAMAKTHLPWGAGYGSWPVVYPEFALFDDGRFANQAHNDWLQWLCEGGIPGVVLAAGLVLLIAGPLLRGVWGCGALVVFVHAAVDYPFHQSAPLVVLIFAVALVAHRDNGRWISCHAVQQPLQLQYAPSPVITTSTVRPRM